MKLAGVVLAVALGAIVVFVGCNKDSAVNAPAQLTDQQVLQKEVATVDSIAQFSSSDEATIDDNGLQDPDYQGLAKTMAMGMGRGANFAIDSLTAVRWGRHIFWDQIVRNYNVVMIGDSEAQVAITKTIPGQFWVGFGTRTVDTVIIDTVVKKPFVETVKRNVLFRRIAHDADRERNWAPVAVTLVRGATDSTDFAIGSLEFNDVTRGLDTTVTDPLNTWFRLGLFRGSIPHIGVGDSIIVHVTVTSANDSAEMVFFRHGIDGGSLTRQRARMTLVSTTGGPGSYTRVYERKFSPHLPPSILAARFNAVVDVFSRGSITSPVQPFKNEYWGLPYIVVR